MYNGIGLPTPRGSGTNGHVQRNWALVKPRVKERNYKTEEDLGNLDTATHRQPNQEILDHERKRKIELKCAEFADILEEQGFSEEAIKNKVNNYRNLLMGQGGKLEKPVDQWGRIRMFYGSNRNHRYHPVDERIIFERLWRGAFCQALNNKTGLNNNRALVRRQCCCHCHCGFAQTTSPTTISSDGVEIDGQQIRRYLGPSQQRKTMKSVVSVTETHQVAEAQQEKNARLREAFGISEYFVDGSSFDPDREAKEKVAKSNALLEKEKQKILEREQEKEPEKEQPQQQQRFELVHTPSPEPQIDNKSFKKKKRKRKESSSSEEPKKKKKSKKRKKERSSKSVKDKKKSKKKRRRSTSVSSDESESSSEKSDDSSSEDEKKKKKKTKKKEKKKTAKKKKQQSSSDSSRESSPEPKKSTKSGSKSKEDKIVNKSKKSPSPRQKRKSSPSPPPQLPATLPPSSQQQKTDEKSRHRSRSRSIQRLRYHEDYHRRSRSPRRRYSRDERQYPRYGGGNRNNYYNRYDDQRKRYNDRPVRRSRSLDINKFKPSNYNRRRSRTKSPPERRRRSESSSHRRRSQRSLSKSPIKERTKSPLPVKEKKRSRSKSDDRQYRNRSRSQVRETKSSTKRRSLSKDFDKTKIHQKSISPKRSDDKKERRKSNDDHHHRDRERSLSRKNESKVQKTPSPIKSSSSSSRVEEKEKSKKQSVDRLKSPLYSREENYSRHKSPERHSYRNRSRTPNKKDNSKTDETKLRSLTPKQQSPIESKESDNEQKLKINQQKNRHSNDKKITEKISIASLSSLKKPLPVVRLRSSSDEEISGNENDREETEDDREMKMLDILKSGLAAKAKESLQKKIPKNRTNDDDIIVKSTTKTIIDKRDIQPDLLDIKLLPLKKDKTESKSPPDMGKRIEKDEFNIESADGKNSRDSGSRSRSKSRSKSKDKRSRSRSSSYSSYRSSSSSDSSRSHSSRSRSRSSRSSSSGTSSSSSTDYRSRSPSIPRRRGSPSFLDRRRITSARKRPIPYHRPTPTSSSESSYSNGSPWCSRRRSTSRSLSPSSRSPSCSPLHSPRSP